MAFLSVTYARSQVVDFAVSYMESVSSLLGVDATFRTSSGVNLDAYITVFTNVSWAFVFVAMAVEALVLVVFFARYKGEEVFECLGESCGVVYNMMLRLGVSDRNFNLVSQAYSFPTNHFCSTLFWT